MFVWGSVILGALLGVSFGASLWCKGPSIKDVGIFFGGGGRSQIPMLQDIRRCKLGKSGSKFRHGGGGYQKRPKNPTSFMDGP